MARRIELFLFSMSQRMGVFLVWLKELNFLIWVKDFNPFFKYAKSYTLFLSIRRKELNPFLWIWRKEMNTFFFHLTQRIETFDQEIWLKELSRVSKKDSKNGTLYKGLIELNLFLWTSSQYDSKSWSLFFNMTRRIEPFLFSNMTQRIDFFKMLKELNLSSIWITYLHDSNWIFFDQYDSKSRIFHKKWLKVLNTFLNLTERVEPFLHWTQRIELFFVCVQNFSKIFLKK